MVQRGHTNIDSMRDEAPPSFQNSFIAGLKTEFTGLNFPANACTETYDCIFTMLGDVTRRPGFDFEKFYQYLQTTQTGAVSSYHWKNAGGDGETQIYVLQIGQYLYFYQSSNATLLNPLSNQILSTIVDLTQFLPVGSILDPSSIECQYADGNGYLFVYHTNLDPFYCSFSNGSITSVRINVKIRDFAGVPEPGVSVNSRPGVLSDEHIYNLENQGWTRGSSWSTTASYPLNAPGANIINAQEIQLPLTNTNFTVPAGLNIVPGSRASVNVAFVVYGTHFSGQFDPTHPITLTPGFVCSGTVVSYSGTNLVIDIGSAACTISSFNSNPDIYQTDTSYTINGTQSAVWSLSSSVEEDLIDTWYKEIGNYPSNADVWWLYKTATTTSTTAGGVTTTIQQNTFDPGSAQGTVTVPTSPAPKGHFIVNAFNQNQSSFVSNITNLTTTVRPRTGAWFQGRVWYAGVDSSQAATGDQGFYTWTENLYFSQIVTDTTDFEKCYQTDDPTDENLFLLLPSDGGVITIQGSGSIFKLFPIQNGMLVFAANGVWFITGSTGIGFTANDYTVTKISAVRSISSTSFVDVNGLPLFWNEEGIYAVEPAQQGLGLMVNPLTVGTIKSFYDQIPYESKRHARGAYDPVNYVVQWLYSDGTNDFIDYSSAVVTDSTKYNLYYFDDSCHLFSSTDGAGNTFVQSRTPDIAEDPHGVGTMLDEWSDMEMAINDQDYLTMLGFDADYQGGFGILGLSKTDGTQGSWKLIDPELGSPAFQDFGSAQATIAGAMTAGAKTILTAPNYFNTIPGSPIYPRISRDGGSTWENINGVPADVSWSRACFSKDGNTMYLKPSGDAFISNVLSPAYIFKSIDRGITWVQLSGGPDYHNFSTDEATQRLRCNADGQIVGMINFDGNFWLSKDGGTTWTNTNFATFFGYSHGRFCDFGITPDGQTLIVGMERNISGNYWPGIAVSKDGGSTWTDVSSNLVYPASSKGPGIGGSSPTGFSACNVSPDGKAMIVGTIYTDEYNPKKYLYNHGDYNSTVEQFIGYALISFDSGTTWKLSSYNMDPFDNGSFLSLFTGIYAVPPVTYNKIQNYNKILNLNVFTKAFYPWTISEGSINGFDTPLVHDIKYIQNPGGEGAPDGMFKYISSVIDKTNFNLTDYTFTECSDLSYVDWDYATESIGLNYDSYFITGYSIDGQGLRKFQPGYINVYSRNSDFAKNNIPNAYTIQGQWDYAISGSSGKWSAKQLVHNTSALFGMVHKRHKIRGHGYSLQLKYSSYQNYPFDIMGWAIWTTMAAGV